MVVVHEGLYRESLVTVRPGSPGAPVTVRAGRAGRVTVSAPGNVLTVRHPHHAFEGLVLDGEMGRGSTLRVRDDAVFVVFRDLVVENSGDNCIDLEGADIVIERTRIRYCLKRDPETGRVRDAHGITGNCTLAWQPRSMSVTSWSGCAGTFQDRRCRKSGYR